MRGRKSNVQHERVPKDVLRLAYLTQPFKDRAAIWQLIFLLQNFLLFLGTWMARGHFTGQVATSAEPFVAEDPNPRHSPPRR